MRERSKSESYSVPDYESSECIIPPPSLFPPPPLSPYILPPSFPPPPSYLTLSSFHILLLLDPPLSLPSPPTPSLLLLSPFPFPPPPHSSHRLQQERLAVIKKLLTQREVDHQSLNEKRLEHLW